MAITSKSAMNTLTKTALVMLGISVSNITHAIIYDGKYDGKGGTGYDKAFNVSYSFITQVLQPGDTNDCGGMMSAGACLPTTDVPTTIDGGILAFGTDGAKQYVFFSHPLGFNDNSYYDENLDAAFRGDYLVGWGDTDHNSDVSGGTMGDSFVGSEHFGFWVDGTGNLDVDTNNASDDLLVRVEYDPAEVYDITDPTAGGSVVRNSGGVGPGMNGLEASAGSVYGEGITAISTIQYNVDQTAGGGVGSGALEGNTFALNSPELAAPCADPTDSSGTSLDASTGAIINDGCYDTLNNEPWIYNLGVELQFMGDDPGGNNNPFFTEANGTDALDFSKLSADPTDDFYVFNYFDYRGVVGGETFAIAHASPSKSTASTFITEIDDDDDDGEVPAPQTLGLLALGLILVRRFHLRGRATV